MSHGYEMYSVGNILNNYVIILYGDIAQRDTVVISFKRIEISNHYAV